MKLVRERGFTLIELLTVIAIIAILAGLTAAVLPGVLERAKIADAETDLKAISTSLSQYYTDNGTYPPAYGYRIGKDGSGNITYSHSPYTRDIGILDAIKLLDRFSTGYDTDGDGAISRLEFLPVTVKDDPTADPYMLCNPMSLLPYPAARPASPGLTGANEKRSTSPRPYIYVPYNDKNLARIKRLIAQAGSPENLVLGETWDPDFIADASEGALIPPPEYDKFVLMSVGPLTSSRGLLTPPGGDDNYLTASGEDPENAYYVLGLRAAYLATRDLNSNGLLDFDYRTRTRQGEAQQYPKMPDGSISSFASPLIFVSQ